MQQQHQEEQTHAAHGGGSEQLLLRPVQTHATAWDPAGVKVSLNIALDGCIVPSTTSASGAGARVDYAHLVVLDGFLDEPTRQGLLDALTAPGWQGTGPPEPQWERATADAAQRPATWGLRADVLAQLAAGGLPAMLEVQSRLCKLYPDMLIAHMPSQHIQLGLQQQEQQQEPQQQEQQSAAGSGVDCSCLLANAAVYGDQFSWHVDADPQCFPEPSTWTQRYGLYCNREPGKPLFVSLLVYLDKQWPRENDAETLFLDSPTDTGIFVRPKPYRAVLMDQDVAHRLSTPSASAQRPRYSLVWKLVMLPKAATATQSHQEQQHWQGAGGSGGGPAAAAAPAAAVAQPCSIARREWGPPTYFGSAAHVLRVAKQSVAQAAAAGVTAAAAQSASDADGGAAGAKRRHM